MRLWLAQPREGAVSLLCALHLRRPVACGDWLHGGAAQPPGQRLPAAWCCRITGACIESTHCSGPPSACQVGTFFQIYQHNKWVARKKKEADEAAAAAIAAAKAAAAAERAATANAAR